MTLQEFFAENARAAIAFSGGVDSSYLLYAAVQCGADVHAYFAKTAFQPRFELDDARRLAESVGARLMWRAIRRTAAITASRIFSEI